MSNIKKYDMVVYIGRFQPLHKAHEETIKNAFKLAHKVLVIVGSSFKPRDYKNPFSFDERKSMIFTSLYDVAKEFNSTLSVSPLVDTIYDDNKWVSNVQKIINDEKNGKSIALIGHSKDESSYYLKMFPNYGFVSQELVEPLDATQIRQIYFVEKPNTNIFASVVSKETNQFLVNFLKTEEFKQIVAERRFIEKYKKQFEHLPYPPIFVTTDAVVVQSGHVLLIQRKSEPGKDLWALPGGFLNANTDKSVETAMIRELKEETKIKVPERILRSQIKNNKVFDAIGRSARGRTITHAFYIELDEPNGILPDVKNASDAKKVKWTPISEIKSEMMFEDHFDIINHFIF